jgi:cysteine desulfurase/selenocysteine lyase
MSFDINLIHSNFPILKQKVNGKPLIYFDNAATTQKPLSVIQTIFDFYTKFNSSSHSQHKLAINVTNKVQEVRVKLKTFLNADSEKSFVFTKSATEAINLVANGLEKLLKLEANDEILLTELEHHANLVPYQVLAKKLGLKLKFVPINIDGDLEIDKLDSLITGKTKFMAFSGLSNVFGKKIEIEKIVKKVRNLSSAKILLDATQLIVHQKIDLKQLDIDFLVFSGHKIYAPLGVGVLYAKPDLLKNLEPYQTGGEMVQAVNLKNTIYAEFPYKFEAGTLNFEAIFGLGSAIDYLQQVGLNQIFEYEEFLKNYFLERIKEVKTYQGLAKNIDFPIFSFNLQGINSLDLATFLDTQGIAVRAGRHCTHPLYQKLGLDSSCRASLSFYNTTKEIDFFVQILLKAEKLLG